jgi:hypothetical protein
MDKSIHNELRNHRKEMERKIKWQELEIIRLTNELNKRKASNAPFDVKTYTTSILN